jgi:uncharacterized protein YndB with AHSA1/START domain
MIDDRLGDIRRTDDGYDLIFERRLSQGIEKVWAALTVPERISEWLMTKTEVELRLGGRFALEWVDEDYRMSGVITELDPPRLIAWTWPDKSHPHSVVRWELWPDEAGCRLRLTQTGVHPPLLVSVAGGWHAYLECLPGAAGDDITRWTAEREKALRTRYEAFAPA